MSDKIWEACVIGCGQIGSEVLKELGWYLGKENVCGVDINPDTVYSLNQQGHTTFYDPPKAKVYIISLWTMDSIKATLEKLEHEDPELIFIESTIDPCRRLDVESYVDKNWNKIVYFPHRFNPNDGEHHIFNHPRLLAATTSKTFDKAKTWLVQNKIMMEENIITCDEETATLAKVVENAYRAMEIILAQELKDACDSKGINFDTLRAACNTKWNIDIREAKDGVKGKCLPKDLAFFNNFFNRTILFRIAELLNNQYVKRHEGQTNV